MQKLQFRPTHSRTGWVPLSPKATVLRLGPFLPRSFVHDRSAIFDEELTSVVSKEEKNSSTWIQSWDWSSFRSQLWGFDWVRYCRLTGSLSRTGRGSKGALHPENKIVPKFQNIIVFCSGSETQTHWSLIFILNQTWRSQYTFNFNRQIFYGQELEFLF